MTAWGNKSGQQLTKRDVPSSPIVSHHQGDELPLFSFPWKPECSAECSGCHPAEHSDMGNPAKAHRTTQVFNGKYMLKGVTGLRPKGLAPCSLQICGSQGQYCEIICGWQFHHPWVTGGPWDTGRLSANFICCGCVLSHAWHFLYTQNGKGNKRKPKKFDLVLFVCK